jgi:hypothetical protein
MGRRGIGNALGIVASHAQWLRGATRGARQGAAGDKAGGGLGLDDASTWAEIRLTASGTLQGYLSAAKQQVSRALRICVATGICAEDSDPCQATCCAQ